VAGVVVPHLDPIQKSDTLPNNDRINMKVNDQASNILNQTQGVVGIADKVGDIYQKYENDKIDSLANVAEQEYSIWNDAELAKLKSYEGDPTDAYADYDKRSREKYDSMLAARPELNERVKRHFTGRLDKTVANQNVAVLKQRGMQQEVYSNNVYESTVKLKKDNLPVVAGYIQADDDSSFLQFENGMSDIKTLVAKRGISKGTVTQLADDDKSRHDHVYQDDDGKMVRVAMSPIAKQRVAKDLSEGVKSSIEVMIAGGRIEEAKIMQEKYKGYIDPVAKVKIDKKFQTAGRKAEAFEIIGGLSKNATPEEIKAKTKDDPELESEVLKLKDSNDRKIQNMKTRKEKANYDTMAKDLIEAQNSDQPILSVWDLENNPKYKATYDNMSPKQQKAIAEMVDAPKDSSPKSELRIQNLFFGTAEGKKIETITPEEFAEETVGLSKADKKKYTNMYMSLRTQSEGEKRAMYTQAGKMLQDQLIYDGHIKRNNFGKIAGDDETTLIEARNELTAKLGSEYGVFKPDQLQQYVKDYSAAKIKGNAFNPKSRKPADTKKEDKQVIKIKNRTEYNNLVRLYSKQNNGEIPKQDDPKFVNFVQKTLKR
jgi:hypothetical protein